MALDSEDHAEDASEAVPGIDPRIVVEDVSGLDDLPSPSPFRVIVRWDKAASVVRVARTIREGTKTLARRLAAAGYSPEMGDFRQRRWVGGVHAYWEVSWTPRPGRRVVTATP